MLTRRLWAAQDPERGLEEKWVKRCRKVWPQKHSPSSPTQRDHCSPQLPLPPLQMGTGQNKPLETAHRIFSKILRAIHSRVRLEQGMWQGQLGYGLWACEVCPLWVWGL